MVMRVLPCGNDADVSAYISAGAKQAAEKLRNSV
jgi:hypothetical protein